MAIISAGQSGHWLASLLLAALLILGTRPPRANNKQQEAASSNLVAASDAFDWFRSIVSPSSSPSASSTSSSADQTASSSDLERESSLSLRQAAVRSPAQLVRSSFRNGRYVGAGAAVSSFPAPIPERDLFKCAEPTAAMYRRFVRQYDRRLEDDTERLERLNLYAVTLKRAIVFNRILQNEITNGSNYQVKAEIGNYHFVEPVTTSGENVGALWYADITDCELGLIKHIVFDIMHLVDKNDFGLALKVVTESSEYLPLMWEDGFEQLANILLLRLYDRFRGDEKMNQLFKWPLYMKKLAAYAYGLRESMRPNFKEKLPLISFAYPAYFKDVKYNWPAINRTGDNHRANNEHKKYNTILARQFSNLRERNKRLVIFRQHWSLINQLNDNPALRFQNTTLEPDWSRISDSHLGDNNYAQQSERLIDPIGGQTSGDQQLNPGAHKYRLTQFSDLSDSEFVAFLTNDYDSLLANDKESQVFLMQNFQLRPLDEALRAEIALELEFRRAAAVQASSGATDVPASKHSLARQVVDELISDVGLPMGPVTVENIDEQEYYSAFTKVSSYFSKSYTNAKKSSQQQSARFVEPSSIGFSNNQLTDADLADERQRRYEIFKENYARFKAWFVKEGWHLNEPQTIAMLRFADLSWHEIKLTLFKVCCLTEANLELLSRSNATIQYLGSNYQPLCQQMQPEYAFSFGKPTGSLRLDQQKQQASQLDKQASEMSALELYYYYCVHFNKHHSNAIEFERKFSFFKKNIDSIRRHSCKRDLTLFNSLLLRQADALSSIDVLDPRRSYTDDLNLDRFEYFNLPKSSAATSANLYATPVPSSDVEIDSSRAGISYRRSSPRFAALLNRTPTITASDLPPNQPSYSYADKLLDWNEDVSDYSLRYKRLNVFKIYEFVLQRYRYCMKTLKGIDLYSSDIRQQCQPAGGQFEDKAATGGTGGPTLWTQDEVPVENNQNRLARLQQQDQCGYYRLGLEPWAEGLTKQDTLSAQLIQTARCQQPAIV